MLRYLTAGESHGKGMVAILEGIPAGLRVFEEKINLELGRRKWGYGRGKRMEIEEDKVEILSGVRKGITLGSPISLLIQNKDYRIEELPSLVCPRPGHADLVGALKYNTRDIRNVLERASARETVARVTVGAVCKLLLWEFKIEIISHVIQIGKIKIENKDLGFEKIKNLAEKSPLRCIDKSAERKMLAEIDKAREKKDTLGGVFEVIVKGVPPGLGSFMQYDLRLDGRLAQAIMAIPSVKAVEIGEGLINSGLLGSQVHDRIYYEKKRGFYRKTNHAGGLEGGITNGEPIIIRGYMKPISTLMIPLDSVNVVTKEAEKAAVERSDICVVPAGGVIGEAVSAFEIARCLREKLGGDSLSEMKRNYQAYMHILKNF
ncbi:MAG: chorismate synthase [Candidatus Omnitrophica bacterium]|nr:chorismate synthase [Candidatus Omnitrophota bacterium]MCM8798000.1 chorismate synthase [Candidatus Omnitrophota bacterium]